MNYLSLSPDSFKIAYLDNTGHIAIIDLLNDTVIYQSSTQISPNFIIWSSDSNSIIIKNNNFQLFSYNFLTGKSKLSIEHARSIIALIPQPEGELFLECGTGQLWKDITAIANYSNNYCKAIFKKTIWNVDGKHYYILDTNNILYKIGIEGSLRFQVSLPFLANDYVNDIYSLALERLLLTTSYHYYIFDEQCAQIKDYMRNKITYDQLLLLQAIANALALNYKNFYLITNNNGTWAHVFRSFYATAPLLAAKIYGMFSLIKSPINSTKSFIQLKSSVS